MNIVYVAKHGCGYNQDEDAISYSLEKLGHRVTKIQEVGNETDVNFLVKEAASKADLLLFHKWCSPEILDVLEDKLVRAFWYFDLVENPDPHLSQRSKARRTWMERVVPNVDIGFCTDGDWVAKDTSGKLVWLMQGADERMSAPVKQVDPPRYPILFAGSTIKCGKLRDTFVKDLASRYGKKFTHIHSVGPKGGIYREQLGTVLANTGIVVAPDFPVSSRYWSNRVYVMLGLGGFLLHPKCKGLLDHYHPPELVMYSDRNDLFALIDVFMDHPYTRYCRACDGFERTLKEHTYRHRCQKLIEEVERRCMK